MRLLINTASTHKGGGVQVAKSFIEECFNFPENEYSVILGRMLSEQLYIQKFQKNFHFYKIPYRPATRVFSFKKTGGFISGVAREFKPDVIFSTTGPAYWHSEKPHLMGFNLAHYIYPESHFYKKISFLQRIKWKLKGEVIRYFYKRDADAIVGQTEDVAKRASDWLKIPSHVVSNTCGNNFRQYEILPSSLLPNSTGEFRFLILSGYYKHKNLEILNEIVPLLESRDLHNVKFVLTLSEGEYQKNFTETSKKYIINVGPVPVHDAPGLYKACDAMFLPTLLESFSASYPEAMAMEKPIVTTDLGFARSICRDAALFYDAVSPTSAVNEIEKLIKDEKLRNNLISKGKIRLRQFDTPSERARKYLDICKTLINQR